MDGSTATEPLARAIRAHFLGDAAPETTHSTTPEAYSMLIWDEADLILVTRPAQEDFEYMEELDNAGIDVLPIARDALVFLNNSANPVECLTLDQLRRIYTGDVTNWKEVGGNDAQIVAYQRTVRSGSQTLFLQLLMGDVEPMEPPAEWRTGTMSFLIEKVSGYKNAESSLGYSVFYYVTDMYGMENIRMLAIDGVAPSRETIGSGEYPLCDYYYAVLRADTPPDAPARRMVEWLLSDEGQSVAAAAGYIPLRPLGEGAQ